MNHRIQELAEQAGWPKDTHQDDMYQIVGPDFTKKFAELIVQECARMAGEQEFGEGWDGPIEDKIKQHFGIQDENKNS